MEPRLVFSRKFVSFPPKLDKEVREQFHLNFAEAVKGKTLITEGRIYSEEIFFRVGISEPGSLKQHNLMTSQVFEPKQALQAIYECVDGASSLLEWFLEDQDSNKIPPVWTEFEFGDLKVFGQYSSHNDELERQADLLLRERALDLVLEDDGLLKTTRPDLDNEEQALFDALVHEILEQLKY